MQKKKVVILGGGTGIFSVLSGLADHASEVSITAIVTMTDNGGSTGILRDEFGGLPVGDMRMALVALSDPHRIDSETLRQLFLYRFDKGGHGLSGHNVGNLLLIALTEILGSETKALAVASRMLGVRGAVLPVTTEDVTLIARYADGVVVRGETHIDEPTADRDKHHIDHITVEPSVPLAPGVADAIRDADLIILGPGDLYTSLLAVCLVGDMAEKIREAKGQFVFVMNLMTKFGQTSGFNTAQYLSEIKKYIGRIPDAAYINDAPLPEALVARYAETGEFPVKDAGCGYDSVECIHADLLATEEFVTAKGDILKRSLIRHDSKKIADVLLTRLGLKK